MSSLRNISTKSEEITLIFANYLLYHCFTVRWKHWTLCSSDWSFTELYRLFRLPTKT